ncbi:hypothetical protein [Halalkalibacter urbisdiaboli]|uniref:hypothetical protein n=1 Tax=Halalkalibacter urbisdiaboli TaxID=1960589 RepID=UPI000B44AFAA|nr:hypothetical protein [Halalkalibacter urbisdiaboli]
MGSIEKVTIQPDTTPLTQFENLNNGTATEEDTSYGLNVVDSTINSVNITYRYLGLLFKKTVEISH